MMKQKSKHLFLVLIIAFLLLAAGTDANQPPQTPPADRLPAALPPATSGPENRSGEVSAPALPNATICSVLGWAQETSDREVSRQILAYLQHGIGSNKTVYSPNGKSKSKPRDPDPMKLSRPIYSLADISGAASSDMRDEIFREYHREEYLNFACQKNRPLIVNWIEDYPKILAGQSAHWRIRPRDIASDFLSGIDLALTKPKEQNEFEFRRLTGEYNSLETLRKSAFVANMFRGPAFGLKQPIVFVTSASLGEYDFANHRFALQTPMTRGAISLRNSFSDSRDVFDAVVVLLHRGRLWQEPNLPLEETSAEKLRNDKPGLIVAIEGNITYPNREFASSFGTAPEKVIFMEITKVLYIAVPEVSKPLYAITTLDLSPHH